MIAVVFKENSEFITVFTFKLDNPSCGTKKTTINKLFKQWFTMVVYTNSLQVLIDDFFFFAGKLTAQEYVDLYHELQTKGPSIEKDAVYSTIWLTNDEYYPIEDRNENDIDENELKAQIKLFLENGIVKGYEIFHQYGGNKVAQYYEQQGIPLDKAVYQYHEYQP